MGINVSFSDINLEGIEEEESKALPAVDDFDVNNFESDDDLADQD